MHCNPHAVTKQFEELVGSYTGAPYVVAVNSCSMALLLAVAWHLRTVVTTDEFGGITISRRVTEGLRGPERIRIEIPKRTYVSVPQSIIHAGGRPVFRDENWTGAYQLKPFRIWDCARRFTSGMYEPRTLQCVSFHWGKILGIQQGGAILLDDWQAYNWLKRARFDGRTEGIAPKDDKFTMIGWHCYMSPEVAAEGIVRLSLLPEDNDDLPNDEYPDLSQIEIFR